jgi:hypothetical protein
MISSSNILFSPFELGIFGLVFVCFILFIQKSEERKRIKIKVRNCSKYMRLFEMHQVIPISKTVFCINCEIVFYANDFLDSETKEYRTRCPRCGAFTQIYLCQWIRNPKLLQLEIDRSKLNLQSLIQAKAV